MAGVILFAPLAEVSAQRTDVSVSGGVESKSEERITVTGPADIEITKKDGTVYRFHVDAGASVSYAFTNDDKGNVKVDVKKLPAEGVLQATGVIDPRDSMVGLAFSSPMRETFGISDVTLPEDITFTANLKVDDWNSPRTASFTAVQSTITLPSFDLLNGQAETGPITVTMDPGSPAVGEIDLRTGEYRMSYGLILDMPNVRLSSGEPFKVAQTVKGIVDKAMLAEIMETEGGTGSLGTTAGIIAVIAAVLAAVVFIMRRMRTQAREGSS